MMWEVCGDGKQIFYQQLSVIEKRSKHQMPIDIFVRRALEPRHVPSEKKDEW